MTNPRGAKYGPVVGSRLWPALERVSAQVVEIRHAKALEALSPDVETRVVLLDEGNLPRANADGEQIAIVAPVQKFLARRFLHLTLEKRNQVVTIEVDLEGLAAHGVALGALGHDIGIAGCGAESWQRSRREPRNRCRPCPA